MYMTETEDRYREALRLVNVSELARRGKRALRTLQAYAAGERRVTNEAGRDLVCFLRERSEELTEAANRLEAALAEEERDE